MKNEKAQTFRSVWDAISDTKEEAANMRARAELMRAISFVIQKRGWTQEEAASHCGVTQPRVSDLVRGKVSKFSLDALVTIATSLHQRVTMAIEDCPDEDEVVAA